MACLLRSVRQERWYEATSSPDDPLPADPLSDLNTKKNCLSVWQVSSDESNLEEIVVAIAAGFGHVQNMDAVLIDERAIGELGLRVEASPGKTPLPRATGYHRDLVQLQAGSLVQVGDTLRRGDFRSFSERTVRELLARYIREGRLSPADLHPDVKSHLQRRNLI